MRLGALLLFALALVEEMAAFFTPHLMMKYFSRGAGTRYNSDLSDWNEPALDSPPPHDEGGGPWIDADMYIDASLDALEQLASGEIDPTTFEKMISTGDRVSSDAPTVDPDSRTQQQNDSTERGPSAAFLEELKRELKKAGQQQYDDPSIDALKELGASDELDVFAYERKTTGKATEQTGTDEGEGGEEQEESPQHQLSKDEEEEINQRYKLDPSQFLQFSQNNNLDQTGAVSTAARQQELREVTQANTTPSSPSPEQSDMDLLQSEVQHPSKTEPVELSQQIQDPGGTLSSPPEQLSLRKPQPSEKASTQPPPRETLNFGEADAPSSRLEQFDLEALGQGTIPLGEKAASQLISQEIQDLVQAQSLPLSQNADRDMSRTPTIAPSVKDASHFSPDATQTKRQNSGSSIKDLALQSAVGLFGIGAVAAVAKLSMAGIPLAPSSDLVTSLSEKIQEGVPKTVDETVSLGTETAQTTATTTAVTTATTIAMEQVVLPVVDGTASLVTEAAQTTTQAAPSIVDEAVSLATEATQATAQVTPSTSTTSGEIDLSLLPEISNAVIPIIGVLGLATIITLSFLLRPTTEVSTNINEAVFPHPEKIAPVKLENMATMDSEMRAVQPEMKTKDRKYPSSVSTLFGSSLLGAAVGGVATLTNPGLVDLYDDPAIPQLAVTVAFGVAGFIGAESNSKLSPLLRNTVGLFYQSVASVVTDFLKETASHTVEEVKAAPGKVGQAIEQKVEETVDEIKSVPGKVNQSVKQRVTEVTQTATEVVEEVISTPGRVADATKSVVNEAVEDTIQKIDNVVDEVKLIPTKISDEIGLPKVEPAQRDLGHPAAKGTFKVDLSSMVDTNNGTQVISSSSLQQRSRVSKTSEPEQSNKAALSAGTFQLFSNFTGSEGGTQKLPLSSSQIGQFFGTNTTNASKEPKKQSPALATAEDVPQIPPSVFRAVPKRRAAIPDKRKRAQSTTARNQRLSITNSLETLRISETEKTSGSEVPLPPHRPIITTLQGIPMLHSWKVGKDERIVGYIVGSETFPDGQQVTTSKILDEIAEDAIIQTVTGSKYYLAPLETKGPGGTSSERQSVGGTTLSWLEGLESLDTKSIFQNEAAGGKMHQTEDDSTPSPPSRPFSTRLQGIPMLYNWEKMKDGRVIGLIAGSGTFKDGQEVTTSRIEEETKEDTIVQTISGSKYYLARLTVEPQKTSSSSVAGEVGLGSMKWFGIGGGRGGGGSESVDTEKTKTKTVHVEKVARATNNAKSMNGATGTAEQRPKMRAEQKTRIQISQNRRQSVEEKQKSQKKPKRATSAFFEEKKQAAKQHQRAPKAVLMEKRKKLEKERKANEEIAAARKAQAQLEKQQRFEQKAAKRHQRRDSRVTEVKQKARKQKTRRGGDTATPKILKRAPPGVPALRDWKVNFDGSVTGEIYGSSDFEKGELVTTSRLSVRPIPGTVVTTRRGSKYYLDLKPEDGAK